MNTITKMQTANLSKKNCNIKIKLIRVIMEARQCSSGCNGRDVRVVLKKSRIVFNGSKALEAKK